MAKEDINARIEKMAELIEVPTRNEKGVYEIGPGGYDKMLESIGVSATQSELRKATGDYVAAAHEVR